MLEGVRYLPARARRKVYIIDEVHMLSAHSWNALLKTLEEPPPHVVFMFATTEAHKIPGTILSRCQRFDFKLIPTARLADPPRRDPADRKDRRRARSRPAHRAAGGRFRARRAVAAGPDHRLRRDRATDAARSPPTCWGSRTGSCWSAWPRAVLDRDGATALRLIARAVDRGVDLGQLGRAFLQFLRDLEVASSVKPVGGVELTDLIDATPEELDDLRALARPHAGGAGHGPLRSLGTRAGRGEPVAGARAFSTRWRPSTCAPPSR